PTLLHLLLGIPLPLYMFLIAVTTLSIMSLNVSDFLYARIIPETRAVMTPIVNPIGPVNAMNAVLNTLIIPPILPIHETAFPMMVTNGPSALSTVPIAIATGPIAAAIPANKPIAFLIAGDKSSNHI